jgi:hypothetical protein
VSRKQEEGNRQGGEEGEVARKRLRDDDGGEQEKASKGSQTASCKHL